jgi:hypothetical protein
VDSRAPSVRPISIQSTRNRGGLSAVATGSSQQKRNKNAPEEDVALIFIRERGIERERERERERDSKRGVETSDVYTEGEGQRVRCAAEEGRMKCKCLNEPLRDCRDTF